VRHRWALFAVIATAVVVVAVLAPTHRPSSPMRTLEAGAPTPVTPIQHVVIIYQENHSFDNVLGALCASTHRCDGVTTGKIWGGTTIPLSHAPDVTPVVNHQTIDQETAIDGGRMDGFEDISGCEAPQFACYSQFQPSDLPVITSLANAYTVSDRTFSQERIPSWTAHLEIVAGTKDGFEGDNPRADLNVAPARGWGCDSKLDAPWSDGSASYPKPIEVPSCVPDQSGAGPYRASPVPYVPTIMDRLDAAGLSWKIYSSGSTTDTGYPWSICPSFYECLGSSQRSQLVDRKTFLTDAAAGTLPAYSIVTPDFLDSQHNSTSMKQGDAYIGAMVSAAMNGPDWPTTAIFITYDDCGCFYDHVPPPTSDLGIRVPMVIVSPYAKAHGVDHTVASFAGTLAFVEWNWSLANLGTADVGAYDYCNAFTFGCQPTAAAAARLALTPKIELHPAAVPAHEQGIATQLKEDDDGT
jgi:phospholipase C